MNDEMLRLAELAACKVLDTPPESGFDDIVDLAATICDVPIALVSLVDERRQWFKARHGLQVESTPREHAFCAHAITGSAPLIVLDATADPRFADNPLVRGQPGVRAYVGMPLQLASGAIVGTLCVIDTIARTFTAANLRALRILANQVVALLELRRGQHAIAALRRRDQQFVRLASAASVGLFVVSKGCCVYVNPAWERITGVSASEALGEGWEVALDEVDRPLAFARWVEASRGEGDMTMELPLHTRGGGRRWVRVRITRLPDGSGAVGTLEDLSEMHEARERAEAVTRRLDALVGQDRRRMSHALHDGVARDLFSASLLLQELRAHGDGRRSGVALTCERLTASIDSNLAELRRLTDELVPTTLAHFPLPLALERFGDAFSREARVTVRVQQQSPLPRLPEAARVTLFRVAEEALVNVAREARASEVSIELEADQENVRLAVRDDGHAGDDALSEHDVAVILGGLDEQVRALGGDAFVRRRARQGTDVEVRLPLACA